MGLHFTAKIYVVQGQFSMAQNLFDGSVTVYSLMGVWARRVWWVRPIGCNKPTRTTLSPSSPAESENI